MATIIESSTHFGAGMVQDRIDSGQGGVLVSKGFDIFSSPGRLIPTRTTATDTAGTGIGNLLIANDGKIYGLGADVANPTTNMQLYQKPDNATGWSALSNEKTGSSHLNFDLFVEYPDCGNVRTIFVMSDPGSAPGFTQLDKANVQSHADHAISGLTSVSQGFVHPKDDVLYIPYTTASGTFIASNTGGVWNDTALTLPNAAYVITSVTSYGNFLAIACAPRGAFTFSATGKTLAQSIAGGSYTSVVFLWDRDSSLVNITESISWGTGILQVLANLNERLIGISNVGGATFNIGDRNSIAIKAYTGGAPILVKEIVTTKQTTTVPSVNINPYVNYVFRDRLYFSIDIIGGSTSPEYHGLWSIGISKETGQYAVTIDRDTPTTNQAVLAAVPFGDYVSMVYNANGTLGFSVNNTSIATLFQGTSYVETLLFNHVLGLRNKHIPDSSTQKKLVGITVTYEPMPSTGQIILKYRKDAETAWTTIFTTTLANVTSHASVNIESSGINLPAYNEINFRIESIGFAVPTGLSFKSEILDNGPY